MFQLFRPGPDEGCPEDDRRLESSKASLSGIRHLLLVRIAGASATETFTINRCSGDIVEGPFGPFSLDSLLNKERQGLQVHQ